MNHNRLIITLGAIVTIGLLAAFSARSIPAAPAIDSPVEAGVSPFDLRCNVKVPFGFAQCGSQASSCQSCHEVQGEDPINDKGDWHTQHAFGDFCEFCHGGNVQSPDKAEAHVGMVEPLGDLKVNCATCHSADYQAKAEVYATTLGVTLNAKPEPTKAPAAEATPAPADAQPAPAETVKQPEAPAVKPETFEATPTSAEVVDYVAQYQSAPLPIATTAGNGLLIAGLAVVGLTVVSGSVVIVKTRQRPTPKPGKDERSQALAKLMPMLDQLDATGLRDVADFVSKRGKPQA